MAGDTYAQDYEELISNIINSIKHHQSAVDGMEQRWIELEAKGSNQ